MKRLTTFLLTLLLFTLGASAQTDYTWKFNIDTWTRDAGNTSAGWYGEYEDGAKERYGDEIAVSGDPVKVLYQTITGLPAGEYTLTFNAVANNAWVGSATGDNIAQVFVTANGTTQTKGVTVYDQTGCTPSDYPHTFTVTVGADGTLEYGMQNIATGGNWYVAQGVSLTYSGDYTPAEGDQVYGCTTMFSHWGITGNTGGEAFQLNTWSTATGMSVPTCEYWVFNTSNLTAATLSHETLTGLQAGTYEVSIKASATAENASGSVGEGTTFNANEASVDLTTGTFSIPTGMGGNYCGTYTVEATVDDAGTLDISFTIPSGVTYNWLQFQDLSVTLKELATEEEEPEPTPEDNSYVFVNTDWVYNAGRTSASDVVYNEDGTITVTASGDNNLSLGNTLDGGVTTTTSEKTVSSEQKWFTIIATNVVTDNDPDNWTSNPSFLWWLNGTNYGSQVPATQVETLSDGRVLVAWDVTLSGIDDNLKADENYLNGWTCFGLTSTTGTSVISDINFYTDEELQAIIASDEEPGTFEPTTVSYTDYLHVELGSEDEVMEATVDVEYTAANVINFTLYDLAVAGTNVGNVTVTGITLEDAEDGVCTFSYSGNDVTVSGGDFDNLIRLVSISVNISGDITEEKLHANMTVDVTMGSSSLLSITADFGYSEAPEPEPTPEDVYMQVYECATELDHWTITGNTNGVFQLDTWSGDASSMDAPVLEYWIGNWDGNISAATISHATIVDLPAGSYEVSIEASATAEATTGSVGEGTTFNANGVSVDMTTGTAGTRNYHGTYTVETTVGDEGTLDISFTVPDGVTYNWLAFKNLKVAEKVSTADIELTAVEGTMNAAVEATMEDAIATFEKTRTASSYYAAVAAIEAAEASVEYYAPIVAAVDALDEDGAAVWAESDYATALTDRTLTNEDVNADVAAAQKAQTTAGSDMTYVVLYDGTWAADQGNGPTPYNTFATETYIESGEATEGTILYETIEGLTPGTYTVSFYVAANMANGVSGDSGEGITQAFANGEVEAITVGTNSGAQITSLDDMTLVTITCTVDSDGVLEFGLQNVADGGNWFLGAVASLTLDEVAEVEDLSELIAQYEADCTAAEKCEANLADMIENGDKTDETKAEMAAALEALEAVMEQYGNIDTTNTTAEELTEAIEAIEAALAEAQDVYTTGLQSVTVATESDAIYTLSGVRVSKAVKGVYIVNGKKVLVK